ncbi:lysine transporter LysE [Skermanella stibiiresistens SB22]|uniref:Lysine transporter LysE n=1 Tax=Skermanella stibiiresistens SB22 TaxID=1385369 RepID=W9H9B8_9PROT|nr:lysine transporter LysE [Skermanella stibiiresistens SB22]
MAILARGILIGVAVAAPVGPIGLLCIRRTLQGGVRMGFVTGLGAAVADGMFGAVAAFGVQFVTEWLTGHQTTFKLVGGAVMLAIAIRDFTSPPHPREINRDIRTVLGGFAVGLGLTLTNPITIFGFVAIFAGLGLGGDLTSDYEAGVLVLGVFLGSVLWFLTLCAGVALLRHKISDRIFKRINQGAAVLLAGFGVYAVASAFG